jgi:predicted RNA methylase
MKNPMPMFVVLLALTACRESPQETAEDVAEARAEGAEDVREAQADRQEAQAEARTTATDPPYGTDGDRVKADYDVAVAQAKATLDVEQEKCEALTGDQRNNCKDAAQAVYDNAVADADLRRAEATRLEAVDPAGNQ